MIVILVGGLALWLSSAGGPEQPDQGPSEARADLADDSGDGDGLRPSEPRQVHFTGPGGTRIVWTLYPALEDFRDNYSAIDARLLALGLADRIHRAGPGDRSSRNLSNLLLYGAADPTVPPDLNAPVLGALLPNTTVHVFPAADHGIEVAGGTGLDSRWRFPRKAPGLFEAIDAWLEEQGLLPTAPDAIEPEDD